MNDRWLTPKLGDARAPLAPAARRSRTAARARACGAAAADLTPPPPPHYDARTPEYAVFPTSRREKWECVRGIDKSFGYNRISREEDFLSRDELIHSFADIVSKNGNLLLNVGPRGEDAAIPEPQLRATRAGSASWLRTNGEAIYGTRPWRRAEGDDGARASPSASRRGTARSTRSYSARPRAAPSRCATWRSRRARALASVGGAALAAVQEGADLVLALPSPLPDEPAHAVALEGAAG